MHDRDEYLVRLWEMVREFMLTRCRHVLTNNIFMSLVFAPNGMGMPCKPRICPLERRARGDVACHAASS